MHGNVKQCYGLLTYDKSASCFGHESTISEINALYNIAKDTLGTRGLFSRAVWSIFGRRPNHEWRSREKTRVRNKGLTETGNRARKVSGTQGMLKSARNKCRTVSLALLESQWHAKIVPFPIIQHWSWYNFRELIKEVSKAHISLWVPMQHSYNYELFVGFSNESHS